MTLQEQIEKAFAYRGHVTITFTDGKTVEGYLFNRQFANPKLADSDFVEVMLKGSGDRQRYSIPSIKSVVLTGQDCAAGNSYEDYLRKKGSQPSGHG